MRVLHVIPSVAPRDGGPSQAVVAMCAALRALEIDARIAATDADGPHALPVTLNAPTEWKGVPALFFRRNATVSFKYSRGLASWLHRHVGDFDVVHVHAVLSHAPLAAAAACRAHKAWRKRVLMLAAGHRALDRAAAIHCTSAGEAGDLRAQGYDNTTVIPLGVDVPVDLEEYRVQPHGGTGRVADTSPYVLSLSRLDPKKNLETLIRAFAEARPHAGPPWRLVVAGDGDPQYAAALREAARKADVEAHVDFVGWVDGAGKQALLGGASLFALPSHHENFGIAVLEAAAYGVPSVVSRGVQLGDSLESAGAAWLTGSDLTSFGAALTAAISDADERARRAVLARTVAERFSWQRVATQLVALYTAVRQGVGLEASRHAGVRAEA